MGDTQALDHVSDAAWNTREVSVVLVDTVCRLLWVCLGGRLWARSVVVVVVVVVVVLR